LIKTAELGCVTPFIVDGSAKWTTKELKSAAKLTVAAKKTNGGSNCLAAQVVVLPGEDSWAQQGEFLRLLNAEVAEQPTARAYYPGARERRDELLEMVRAVSHPLPS